MQVETKRVKVYLNFAALFDFTKTWFHRSESVVYFVFKSDYPGLFLSIFILFKHKFTEKAVGVSVTWNWIIGIEGKHTDHLTTTTVPLLILSEPSLFYFQQFYSSNIIQRFPKHGQLDHTHKTNHPYTKYGKRLVWPDKNHQMSIKVAHIWFH